MTTFYRLLGFLRPYKSALAVSWALASVAMVMTVLLPYLMGQAVEKIHRGTSAAHRADAVARAHDRHQLTLLAGAIVLAVLARWALTYWRRMIAGRVSLGIEYDLRERVYGHLQRLELGFFDHQQTGQLMSRATVDLQAVRFFLGYGLVFILQSILTILLAGAAMIKLNPELGLISLAPVPFVVLISQRYGRIARPAIQEVQQRIAELTANAEENISGVRVVKSFAREPLQLARFRRTTGRVFEQAMVATRIEAKFNPMIGFLPQLGLVAVLLVGGRAVIHGHLSLGDFTSFYLYLNMLIGPMRALGVTLGLAQRATASGARIFQVLDREPRLRAPAGARALPPGNGHVEMRGVTLRYDTQDGELGPAYTAAGSGARSSHATSAPEVLHDIDLDVPAGTTVALVGATGSGKTSLVALISRLYDPSDGTILLDGADVASLDLSSLRHAVAVVSDDPFLFSASVAENVAYGRSDASAAEIEAAARRAQAYDFITRLPDGFSTRVGERGFTLSGGQRQRIAIARALLVDPRVLILDDATSSVDASTERQIKLALAEAMAGRTTFIIAHRLSTIALADEIVVLDDGRVAARGTHDELLDASPLYREIVEKGLPDQVFLTRKPISDRSREREVSGL
ncbi:MAG TPA: ABC transporter ATP-binding protein [Solirubrobacteraceae bacterium]|nr:ABC transporter ATP-binding protein [Solirubrobacteraceae bacterium]